MAIPIEIDVQITVIAQKIKDEIINRGGYETMDQVMDYVDQLNFEDEIKERVNSLWHP